MSLKKIALAALLLTASLPAAGAAAKDDQTYAVLHAGEPAIPAGWGRIYFYREGGIDRRPAAGGDRDRRLRLSRAEIGPELRHASGGGSSGAGTCRAARRCAAPAAPPADAPKSN